jgi:hypothetical protein
MSAILALWCARQRSPFWLAAGCLPEPVVRGLFDALLTFFLRTVDRFL